MSNILNVRKRFIDIISLVLLLTCFTWGLYSYYFVFLISIFSIRLLRSIGLKKYQLSFLLFIYFFNISSALSGMTRGIPLNTSWFLQIFIFPLILFGIDYLFQLEKKYFTEKLIFIFKLTLLLLITQSIIGLLELGFYFFSGSKSSLLNLASNFSYSSFMLIGLYKSIISWVSFSLFLTISQAFTKVKRRIYLCIILFCTIITGVKSVIFGIFVVGVFYWILSRQFKLTKYFLIFTIIILSLTGLIFFFDTFNELMIFEGRYFKPIFSSIDFWNTPFGFGMGNYFTVAMNGYLAVDTEGFFVITWLNSGMSQYGMIPVPESDVLLLSVTFGWIFYAILLILIFTITRIHLLRANKKTDENIRGFMIFIFIISSGVFQDWFGTHTTWIFIGLSLSMMFSKSNFNFFLNGK